MRKTLIYLMIILLSLNAFPTPMTASEKDSVTVAGNPTEVEEIKSKLARLNEIKTMNKSSLNHSEKKALRKEAKTIKASLKKSNGTNIYYAVGAAIIILIVLIPLIGN